MIPRFEVYQRPGINMRQREVSHKRLAKELKLSDMSRYWLFCYETLTWGSLCDEWKAMKQA